MAAPWNQEHFRIACQSHMKANNLTKAALALEFGITEGSLHQYMYNKEKRPSIDVIQSASKVLGKSITEFIDDPGVPGESETDRYWGRAMGSDLAKMTESQKQSAIAAWRAIVQGYEPSR